MASDLAPVVEVYGLALNFTESTKFLCGVEYEIEQISKFNNEFWEKGYGNTFTVHDDNSLRNHGKEIVTTPMSFEKQLEFFELLHKKIEWHGGYKDHSERFSERTSTHVHVNVKPLIMNKVAQFVRLYILFEPYFFSLVDSKRKDSIFCVPLNYTFLPKIYNTNITNQISKWHKYTAFNILPVKTQGTIEFRHLQGTGDFAVFKKWLTTIKNLYDYNLENNVDFPSVLRSTTLIDRMFHNIFGENETFDLNELDDTILDLKLTVQKYTVNNLMTLIAKTEAK